MLTGLPCRTHFSNPNLYRCWDRVVTIFDSFGSTYLCVSVLLITYIKMKLSS